MPIIVDMDLLIEDHSGDVPGSCMTCSQSNVNICGCGKLDEHCIDSISVDGSHASVTFSNSVVDSDPFESQKLEMEVFYDTEFT